MQKSCPSSSILFGTSACGRHCRSIRHAFSLHLYFCNLNGSEVHDRHERKKRPLYIPQSC